MTVDSRWQVFFTSTGPGAGAGRAVAVYKDNVEKKFGTVASGGIQGRNVDFTLRWDDGSLWVTTPSCTVCYAASGCRHRVVSREGEADTAQPAATTHRAHQAATAQAGQL